MANEPTSKTDDPAALAFSAVENALRDSVFAPENLDPPKRPVKKREEAIASSAERRRTSEKIAGQTTSVANDDRLTGTRLIYNMQARSSGTPLLIAAVVALGWFVLTGGITFLRFGAEAAAPGGATAFLASSEFSGLLALIGLPIVGFFAVAILVRRAHELRVAATSMAQAAMRLTDPETTAADKVATVGQAVRREVNALGDGLERALSRAGELEVMVHNEVTALERTYSENEARLRALIQNLAEQRDAVILNSDRVRDAIGGAHTAMIGDLEQIGASLSATITEHGSAARSKIEGATGAFQSLLEDRSGDLIDRLENRTVDMSAALDEKFERLDGLFGQRSGELASIFDSRTNTLSTAIEARMDSLIEEIDGRTSVVSAAIEDKTGRISAAMSEGSAAMIAGLDEREKALAETLEALGSRVVTDIGGRTLRAEEVLTSLIDRLEESMSIRVNAIESSFQSAIIEIGAVIEENADGARSVISGAGGAALSSLTTRVDEVALMLDSRLGAMDAVVADKGERLITLLDQHTTNFNDRATSLESSLIRKTEQLGTTLEDRTQSFAQTADDRTQVLSSTLDLRAEAFAAAAEERAQRIEQVFDTRLDGLIQHLDDRTSIIDAALSQKSAGLAEILDSSANLINNSLVEKSAGLAEILDTRVGMLDLSLSEKSAGLAEILDTRTSLIDSALAQKTKGLAEVLDTRTHNFGQMIEARSDAFSSAIENTAGAIDEAIALRTNEFAATLETRTGEMSFAIDESTRALGEALGTQTRAIAERIATRSQQLSEALSSRTQEFGDALSTRTEKLSDVLSHETATLSDALDSRTRILNDELETRTMQISAAIDGQGAALESRMAGAINAVVTTMADQSNRVSSLIEGRIDGMNDSLGRGVDSAVARLGDVESGLTARLASVSGKIVDSAREAAQAIENSVDHASNSITEMVDKRLGTLPEAITARAEITADRLSELNRTLAMTMTQTMSDLESGADRIEETITTRITKATASLSTDVEQTAARMDVAVRTALEQVKNAARHIEDLVEVKAVRTAEQLSAQIGEMQQSVAEQSASFAQIIDSRSEQLRASLKSHGNILRDALSVSVQESEEVMAGSTARITGELNDALKRLNDSNLLLQRVLETTTSNLASLEGRVADQTSIYSTTVKDALSATEEAGGLVSRHVDAFQKAISAMTGEFSELVGSLDSQAFNIDRAATNLKDAGNFSIDTLENRRGAMEALAESFTSRADEIDERMRTFANSIAETVSDTERRLVSARQAMEQALASTSSAVTRGLETFTTAADSEGRRANQLLEDAQRSMLSEMQSTLDEATRRFNDTAAAMRATAGQVGHELESTRAELQRGVLELPEETRASAAAMRRVVAEQIEALNELNAIVRNQSGTHDVSMRRQPRREEPAPAPRYSEPPRMPETRMPETRMPETRMPETRMPEPRSVEPRRDDLRRDDMRPIEARQPVTRPSAPPASTADITSALESVMAASSAPVAPRSLPQRENAPAAADQGGGWLRDVLRNASASQASAPRQTNFSGLSGEIAHAIEPTALAEAWQRYQAGETNVFSRRIYTLTGQGVYDEVRKKMQRDPDFAATATAYMEEFEQYLRRAASGPQASNETRALLLSDRGKVYTMLAHAGGRLH